MAKEDFKEASSKKEQPKAKESKDVGALSFNVWFSDTVNKRPEVKPHHMPAIKAHFKAIGLGEMARPEDFNEGLKNYGL